MKLALTVLVIVAILALVMFVISSLFMCYLENEYDKNIGNYDNDNE